MGLLGGQSPGARAAGTPSPSPAIGQPIRGRSTGSNACVPATGSTSAGTAGYAPTGYRAAGSSQRKTSTSPMPEATNYSCSRPVRQRARRGNGSSSTHGPLPARADTAKSLSDTRRQILGSRHWPTPRLDIRLLFPALLGGCTTPATGVGGSSSGNSRVRRARGRYALHAAPLRGLVGAGRWHPDSGRRGSLGRA